MIDQGIPTLKQLFNGILIDIDSVPNRHLQQADLAGRVLHLEIMEVPEEEGEGLEGDEETEDYDPLGLADDLGEEDEEDEVCNLYPDGCSGCAELECDHEVDDPPEGSELGLELRVTLLYPDHTEPPQLLDDNALVENPALCRYLSQIKGHNGL